MSRERAERRAERERAAAAAQQRNERTQQRAARGRARRRAVRTALSRRTRWRSHQGLLARRRRAQNAGVLGVSLVLQAIVWLVWDDPWVRVASALLGVLTLPVLVTLVFDRRS